MSGTSIAGTGIERDPDGRSATTVLGQVFTVVALASCAMPSRAESTDPMRVFGKTPAMVLHAEGVQVYDCTATAGGTNTWTFREPLATLIRDGQTIGRHFAGPSWELNDRSRVTGKVAAEKGGRVRDDIPWLRLDVVDHRGYGGLSTVTSIQRVNTHGGVYVGSCDRLGDIHLEQYSADYVFFAD